MKRLYMLNVALDFIFALTDLERLVEIATNIITGHSRKIPQIFVLYFRSIHPPRLSDYTTMTYLAIHSTDPEA